MAEKLLHFSIVKYVPRADRGEFVNVGVICVDREGRDGGAEFTTDWRRVRAIGRGEHIALLQNLSKYWKVHARAATEKGVLFPSEAMGEDWLREVASEASNIVQLTEPRRAFAESADALARELLERYVQGPRRAPERGSTKTKRGIQLVLEGRLRKVGLGGAYERNYVADVGKLAEWTFDYAVKNGRPQHFVQTMNLNLGEAKRILADATYVAYAKRDLRDSVLGDVPVSVVADPAESGDDEVTDEVRAVLHEHAIPLILRPEIDALVNRLVTVVGPGTHS
jgi:hypothetical protein